MQTSTYYADALPAWAARANEAQARAADVARRNPWTPLLAAAAYRGTVSADSADIFPHPVRTGKDDARTSAVPLDVNPFALDELFDFAEASVTGESLGVDDVPDLLVISVSVTDYVGHRYGPDSPEALDLAARTDRRMAQFLRFLDAHVGAGRYVVTITADHGVPRSRRSRGNTRRPRSTRSAAFPMRPSGAGSTASSAGRRHAGSCAP